MRKRMVCQGTSPRLLLPLFLLLAPPLPLASLPGWGSRGGGEGWGILLASAQMEQPLLGQGVDPVTAGVLNESVPVYVSVSLEKLHEVDGTSPPSPPVPPGVPCPASSKRIRAAPVFLRRPHEDACAPLVHRGHPGMGALESAEQCASPLGRCMSSWVSPWCTAGGRRLVGILAAACKQRISSLGVMHGAEGGTYSMMLDSPVPFVHSCSLSVTSLVFSFMTLGHGGMLFPCPGALLAEKGYTFSAVFTIVMTWRMDPRSEYLPYLSCNVSTALQCAVLYRFVLSLAVLALSMRLGQVLLVLLCANPVTKECHNRYCCTVPCGISHTPAYTVNRCLSVRFSSLGSQRHCEPDQFPWVGRKGGAATAAPQLPEESHTDRGQQQP